MNGSRFPDPTVVDQFRRLEAASLAEATTLLLLVGVAVPLKHLGGWAVGVSILGPVHGLAFALYVWLGLQAVAGGGWTQGEATRLFAASVVPFGGFANMPFLSRKLRALRAQSCQA